jgi:hypothetical protein
MNRKTGGKQTNSAGTADSVDRILSSEEQILPSSGFLTAVMERVEEESRVPAPIPFPWKRALLAIPLVIGVVGLSVYEFVRYGIPTMPSAVLPEIHLSVAPRTPMDQAVWVALALVVSFLSWKLARRITGQA